MNDKQKINELLKTHADDTNENARLLIENAQLREALNDANQFCRSALSIAERQGNQTNWSVFQASLRESLARQHAVLFPKKKAV